MSSSDSIDKNNASPTSIGKSDLDPVTTFDEQMTSGGSIVGPHHKMFTANQPECSCPPAECTCYHGNGFLKKDAIPDHARFDPIYPGEVPPHGGPHSTHVIPDRPPKEPPRL